MNTNAMNTTRYEQTAALVAEKKASIEPLIAELRTLPPFPDDAIALTGCKPTIGDMRRKPPVFAPASSVRATPTPIPSTSPAASRKARAGWRCSTSSLTSFSTPRPACRS